MKQDDINKLVNKTLESFDGAERARTKPFLLTRIFAKMQAGAEVPNFWSSAVLFLSRPVVAMSTLIIIVGLNVFILLNQSNNNGASVATNITSAKDEFAMNVISIYDFENQEP